MNRMCIDPAFESRDEHFSHRVALALGNIIFSIELMSSLLAIKGTYTTYVWSKESQVRLMCCAHCHTILLRKKSRVSIGDGHTHTYIYI